MTAKPVPLRPPAPQLVTEDSAALEFVRRFGEMLRYDHSAGAWFRFDGATWIRDETDLARDWAREIARELAAGASDDRIRYTLGRAAFAKGVELFARADRRVAVEASLWDRDPFLLATPGGTVDLRTGELREPDPADLITMSAAVAPAASADCPRWRAFLDQATGGDADLIAFLKRWAGYCLTGDVREHTVVFIVGSGMNGKSVFLNTLRGLMGSYARNAAMDAFVASYGSKHPTDIASLAGSRLVTASETDRGKAWDEARLTALSGGDTITAHFMRQDDFNFVPTFKLTFAGNHKPDLKSVNVAMRRRLAIVPFERRPAAPDRQLEHRLRAEWPGILRWAVEGGLEWQARGLGRAAGIVAASEAYFAEQDTFGRWIEDECIVEPANELLSATAAALSESWRAFAARNGKAPGRGNEFAEALEARGVKRGWIERARGYRGIALRSAKP